MFHSKSINDIIRETNIAYTTCYRKTNWLLNEGLLKVDKIVITPEGKKFSQFIVYEINQCQNRTALSRSLHS